MMARPASLDALEQAIRKVPHPLAPSLAFAVPFTIADLRAQGRPSPQDWQTARSFAQELIESGDVLLYGGATGEGRPPAALWTSLVRAIAVLSFAPGGITVFGQHWESMSEDAQ